MKTRMKRKSVGAEAESYLDLPRTRTWNLLMTTFGTEMVVFRSQVRVSCNLSVSHSTFLSIRCYDMIC
jgi:hypothetical protein